MILGLANVSGSRNFKESTDMAGLKITSQPAANARPGLSIPLPHVYMHVFGRHDDVLVI